jgi:hypothetical protein
VSTVELSCDGCDGVETILNEGEEVELHHVVPDDGMLHEPSLFGCPCNPRLEWHETDLAIVLHIDAETGEPVGDRPDE